VKEWKMNLKYWAKPSIFAKFGMPCEYVEGSCLGSLTKTSVQYRSPSTQ